jgi:hypothetical protein
MRKWITLSTLLHLLVFILLWLGLPHFNKPDIVPSQIVTVDIASIKDITAVKVAPPKPAEPKPEVKPEPPKPPEPKPPEPKPPAPAPAPAPTPSEQAAPPKPEEKAEPLPTPKPKPKPKPEPPKEQKDPLSSILKNVSKMKSEIKPDDKPPEKKPEPSTPDTETKPTPQKEPSPAPTPPQVPATAEHLSISEEDALRNQLRKCWNIDPGAKGIDTMAIDIYLTINQDRTVRDAIVVDQARMATDPFFRTVAESAIRALKNPICSPLALPPEKYDQWKDTVMTFRPKDML